MKSEYERDKLGNSFYFQDRMLLSMRGLTVGIVLDMIDAQRDYTNVIEKNFEDENYANSINIIPDGIGTIYCAVTKADGKEFKFRVTSDDLTFNECFGDIKKIQITATCPYRAIIRG